MSLPTDLCHAKEHEWLRIDGDVVTVGSRPSPPTPSATWSTPTSPTQAPPSDRDAAWRPFAASPDGATLVSDTTGAWTSSGMPRRLVP